MPSCGQAIVTRQEMTGILTSSLDIDDLSSATTHKTFGGFSPGAKAAFGIGARANPREGGEIPLHVREVLSFQG
jgi:hypothetical protein